MVGESYLVTSFFTIDTPYEQVVKTLIASLEKFSIEYFIKGLPNEGSWTKNCNLKPAFIASVMEMFPNKNIVFLDADAEVMQYPALFDVLGEECDFAVHYFREVELLTGTMFFRNCPIIHKLLSAWRLEVKLHPDVWDQKLLQKIVPASGIKVSRLPDSYTHIMGLSRSKVAPIIRQHQASRRHKRSIKAKVE